VFPKGGLRAGVAAVIRLEGVGNAWILVNAEAIHYE